MNVTLLRSKRLGKEELTGLTKKYPEWTLTIALDYVTNKGTVHTPIKLQVAFMRGLEVNAVDNVFVTSDFCECWGVGRGGGETGVC